MLEVQTDYETDKILNTTWHHYNYEAHCLFEARNDRYH